MTEQMMSQNERKKQFCCPNCGDDILLNNGKWGCVTNNFYTCWEGTEPSTKLAFLENQRDKALSERNTVQDKINRLEQEIAALASTPNV